MKTFGTEFENFIVRSRFLNADISHNISTYCDFNPPYYAMITDHWKFTTLYGIFSFHFTVRINSE